jgi:PadR family transcriptional regulator PadR
MSAQFERQIKKGVLEMLVLNLIYKEPMYGYQIIQTLKQESDGVFTLKEGTLYPILYRLEENGFALSEWTLPADGKAAKKFYRITDEGKQERERQLALWSTFVESVNLMIHR